MADADDSREPFLPYLNPIARPRSGSWVSMDEAIGAIEDRARVFLAASAGTPVALSNALADAHGRFTRIDVVSGYLMTRPRLFEHAGAPFHFITTQASLAFKHLWDTGSVRVLPARYSDYSGLLAADGPMAPDVALIQVSSPGPNGRVSLGLSVGANVDAARSANLVIAQVNPRMPFTYGAGELEIGEIDLLVEHEEPVLEARPADTSNDPDVATIARLAAAEVPNGATIQFGVGAMPDAILGALSGHTGLSVHSGMLSDVCVELLEAGAISMTGKGFDDGVMIAAEVVSTPSMMAWIDRNPTVRMAPPAYSHGAAVLGRIPHFVAINSAVEIALDGSANSETASGRVMSGPGGAPDYAFGASVSSGGRFICALKSTASKGKISRIVPTIGPPDRVTLPAYLADRVVTEHGCASLRGLTQPERAVALRSVAAPHHREGLAHEIL